jgi:general secretion pathway protein D
VQAPKISLFNGQDGTVADTVSRPFVVSAREVRGDQGIAYSPVVRVVEEGTVIAIRPTLSYDHTTSELGMSCLGELY